LERLVVMQNWLMQEVVEENVVASDNAVAVVYVLTFFLISDTGESYVHLSLYQDLDQEGGVTKEGEVQGVVVEASM
jgi:hypothetical protein